MPPIKCQVWFGAAYLGDFTEFYPPEKEDLLRNILCPKAKGVVPIAVLTQIVIAVSAIHQTSPTPRE